MVWLAARQTERNPSLQAQVSSCCWSCDANIWDFISWTVRPLSRRRKPKSWNSVVWSLSPKESFAGPNSGEAACAMAVTHFNDGSNTSRNIMKRCSLNPGKYVWERAEREDIKHIYRAERKTEESAMTARQQGRTERRHQEERNIQRHLYVQLSSAFSENHFRSQF